VNLIKLFSAMVETLSEAKVSTWKLIWLIMANSPDDIHLLQPLFQARRRDLIPPPPPRQFAIDGRLFAGPSRFGSKTIR
jgi:hypothetical protein